MEAATTGINPCGLRIWTSRKTLPPDQLDKERASRFLKLGDTEQTAGGREDIQKVASRQIGARCVR